MFAVKKFLCLTKTNHNLKHLKTSILLLFLMISICNCFTSKATTYFDGVTWDVLPSYYRLDGTNGIRVTCDTRQAVNIDYLIKLWIRPQRPTPELGTFNETIFEI